ncbi:hypothetical protein [Edaphobacter acidisoli]|uniref:hypothetical protein n=1 Tax=Edaphobacter acidisoli TaxID=2040573 RepID=UPI001E283824|nr:hypothetical protein [Edaphobacter acidisoli]
MLARVGALVPLVLSEFGALGLLIVVAFPSRTGKRPYGLICGLAIVAIVLGFSLFKIFRNRWATLLGACVSIAWLVLGLQTLYDVRVHPQYNSGDEGYIIVFMIPFGAVGIICWVVLFLIERHADRSIKTLNSA